MTLKHPLLQDKFSSFHFFTNLLHSCIMWRSSSMNASAVIIMFISKCLTFHPALPHYWNQHIAQKLCHSKGNAKGASWGSGEFQCCAASVHVPVVCYLLRSVPQEPLAVPPQSPPWRACQSSFKHFDKSCIAYFLF